MTPEHKAVAELAFNTKYLGCETFAECPPHVQRLWLDAWEAATFHAATCGRPLERPVRRHAATEAREPRP